jgi:hypothetical protein
VQGHALAQYNLGCLYREGKGVPQDYAEAARLYTLAAAQGFAPAHRCLSYLYTEGKGVSQDVVEATRLWRLAAAQGVAETHALFAKQPGERVYFSVCCLGCGATRELKMCAKCKVARFCSAECQRRTWAEHKSHCKRWEAEAAGGEP